MKLVKLCLVSCLLVLVYSCHSSKNATGSANLKTGLPANEETYGYSEKNPIKVGGVSSGPSNERKYLDALTGPNGEKVTYERLGSCCMFKTKNGMMGNGLLDKYQVSYEGLQEPVILYLNMYDTGELKAPKGFLYKSLTL